MDSAEEHKEEEIAVVGSYRKKDRANVVSKKKSSRGGTLEAPKRDMSLGDI